jgi:hypothetical protein
MKKNKQLCRHSATGAWFPAHRQARASIKAVACNARVSALARVCWRAGPITVACPSRTARVSAWVCIARICAHQLTVIQYHSCHRNFAEVLRACENKHTDYKPDNKCNQNLLRRTYWFFRPFYHIYYCAEPLINEKGYSGILSTN